MKAVKLLFVVIFLNILFISNSQSQDFQIKRKDWKIVQIDSVSQKTSHVLQNNDIKMMFSDTEYKKYMTARQYYIASIPLLTLSACFMTTTIGLLVTGIGAVKTFGWSREPITGFDPTIALRMSTISFLVTLIPLIPAITLIVYGSQTINKLVDGYNMSKRNPLQVYIGIVNNGIGICLKF